MTNMLNISPKNPEVCCSLLIKQTWRKTSEKMKGCWQTNTGKDRSYMWQEMGRRRSSLGNSSQTREHQLTLSPSHGWGGKARDVMIDNWTSTRDFSLFPLWKVRQGTSIDTTVCQHHAQTKKLFSFIGMCKPVKIIYILFCSPTIYKISIILL